MSRHIVYIVFKHLPSRIKNYLLYTVYMVYQAKRTRKSDQLFKIITINHFKVFCLSDFYEKKIEPKSIQHSKHVDKNNLVTFIAFELYAFF